MIRIIIGAGASAAVFRRAINQTIDQEVFTNPRKALVKLRQTIQIGRTEPWHLRGHHRMDQPPSIVGGHMLPGSEQRYETKDKRFAEAFPPGNRNFMMRSVLNQVRQLKDIEQIYGMPNNPLNSDRPKVVLKFRGDEDWVYVDQLVYAMGSDFMGRGGIGRMLRGCSKSVIARSEATKQSQEIWLQQRDCFAPSVARNDMRGLFEHPLSQQLQDDLIPYKDINRVVSDGTAVLALGTEDRALILTAHVPCSRWSLSVGVPVRTGSVPRSISRLAAISLLTLYVV